MILVILGDFGHFWVILAILGDFGHFGAILAILGDFGHFWVIFGHFGRFSIIPLRDPEVEDHIIPSAVPQIAGPKAVRVPTGGGCVVLLHHRV